MDVVEAADRSNRTTATPRPTSGDPGSAGATIHEEADLKRMRTAAAASLLILAAAGPVRAQDAAPADSNAVTKEELQGLLDGMNEQIQVLTSDTDKLKKFKFSGYIQARAEFSESSNDSVRVSTASGTIASANATRIYIRRARLKLTYDSSPLSQMVLQIDGGQDRTVRLLDGYITLLDPWTPLHDHQLTAGQFNVPFGYEIERSSSVRELPERSRAENVLFSGERDRGVKLESQWTPQLKTTLAVLNGTGINSVDFPATDPTRGKDWLARARFAQGTLDGAVSYYSGRNVVPLTGPDVLHDKTRLGIDAQGYWSLASMGGGSLRGEFYSGHEVNADSVRTLVVAPTAANPNRLLRPGADPEHLATDFTGWYVMAVQNFGDRLQAAVRFDTYDPNTNLDHDQYERWSFGLNAYYDGFTRLTVSYDDIRTQASAGGGRYNDPPDNLWTIQLQHKF